MSDLLPKRTWADRILDGEDPDDCGPYIVNPKLRRLMLLGEIRAHPRSGYTRSDGFQSPAGSGTEYGRFWAGPGMLEMFRNRKVGYVRVPEGEDVVPPNDWADLWRIYTSGEGFPYEGDFYMLPRTEYEQNTMTHHPPGKKPFSIFVGYRGQSHPYPNVLTPSAVRGLPPGDPTSYLRAYMTCEGYATDLLREAYFRLREQPLQDLQAIGILQHHKIINTSVLDLSYDLEVAKLFALVNLGEGNNVQVKSWRHEHDYSSVFKVIVRLLDRDGEPLELPAPYRGQLQLLPFNICPLSAVTDTADRERGFGAWGFGENDLDKFGTVLNITEWRYHPTSNPNGWDGIGGVPDARLLAESTWLERRRLLGLAPEPRWLEELELDIRRRVARRFSGNKQPSSAHGRAPSQ
jgi:hypothetical protein